MRFIDLVHSCVKGTNVNICITFIQHRPNVYDIGPTLYKRYTNDAKAYAIKHSISTPAL